MEGLTAFPPQESEEDRLEREHIEAWLKDEGFLPVHILTRKKMAEVIFVYRKYEHGAWVRSLDVDPIDVDFESASQCSKCGWSGADEDRMGFLTWSRSIHRDGAGNLVCSYCRSKA